MNGPERTARDDRPLPASLEMYRGGEAPSPERRAPRRPGAERRGQGAGSGAPGEGVAGTGGVGYSRVERTLNAMRRGAPVAIGSALALAAAACSDVAPERDVRATIVDEAGRPLPGAVFWAEARDAEGVLGWLVAVAGQAGEVPDSAREPLKIPWSPGARLTLAAFAPGRIPAVVGGEEKRIRSDGAVLTPRLPTDGQVPPVLDRLAFPFEDSPALASRLRQDPRWPVLAAAFREALTARKAAAGALTAAEIRKEEQLSGS